MKIKIDVGEEPLYYYTTVMWLTSNKFYEVFSLAQEFVTKSFNKDTGRILINYMENNANADPNQLNEVTIASSYDQLTWGSSYISTLSNATSNQWTFERENLNMTAEINLLYNKQIVDENILKQIIDTYESIKR